MSIWPGIVAFCWSWTPLDSSVYWFLKSAYSKSYKCLTLKNLKYKLHFWGHVLLFVTIFLSELLCQFSQAYSHFVCSTPPCLRCLLVSQVSLIKKLAERTCFIALRKELNVLYFYWYLLNHCIKIRLWRSNLLLLNCSLLPI